MADELWKECANWLIRCQVLPPDHKVTWANAKVIDLANTLRDGVLLCQLLNRLVPGCIDLKEMSLRPQMSQFLCLKNIRTFLQSCQNEFNLKVSDLFDPHMLFEYTDFKQVLHTLSLLSRSPKAESTGIKGFTLKTPVVHDYYNEDIFRNLEDAIKNEAYGEFDEYQYSAVTSKDDDIYEDLCAFRRNFFQIPSTPSAPVEKRDYCIKELYETEKNYVDALNMIIKHFMRPLKSVLSQEDRNVIFKHIQELSENHMGFQNDLRKACNSSCSQHKISDCFLRWKEKFIIYGDYCSNLPKAQEHIDDLCAKNELINQSVLRCQEEANKGKFKLRDLLSVPMQRILKYHLLLKELLRNTSATHEDYKGLEKALDAMLDLAQYINEVKRDNETLQIIKDIQASITYVDLPENTELKDYGRLLKDGELKVKSHEDNNRIKNRYIFVFDRVMLMCKATKSDQYIYKEALALCDYKIEDAPLKAGFKWPYLWYLVHRSNRTAYNMYAKTEEIKKKWIEAIQKAQDNLDPAANRHTNHHFEMYTFEIPTSCSDCGRLLRGIFFQGYKCSVCGEGVHKSCIGTVRPCGAPSLPPRPTCPISSHPSSESLQSRTLVEPLTNGFKCPISTAKAKLSYSGGASGHLSFEEGDSITILRKINTTLWEGQLQNTGEEGLFPAAYVEEMDKRASYEDPSPNFRNNHARHPVGGQDGYVNLNLEEYPWFAGTLDRDCAQGELEKMPNGAFLLRISPKQNGGYAISINYESQVKHMRVCSTDDGQFYLSENKLFRSIVELISWYEDHSLAESFNGLKTKLMIPFKKVTMTSNGIDYLPRPPSTEPIGYAVALHDFLSTSTPNTLELHKNDRVAILSKAGGERGWWKGQIETRIGYFPLAYVREVQE